MWASLHLEQPGQAESDNLLSDIDMRAIVERASGAFERLGPPYVPAADENASDALRDDWKDIVAGGDEARFRRRLTWDGLGEAEVTRMLGPVRLQPGETLPEWVLLLRALCEEAEAEAAVTDTTWEITDPADPLPYEDALAPWVRSMVHRLAARVGRDLDAFSAASVGAMGRALLRRLGLFTTETLHLEFGIYRRRKLSALDLILLKASGESSREVYDAFIASLHTGGLKALCLHYPVMARLAATACLFWLDATAELVQRFAADRALIGSTFEYLQPPLHVTEIETLLSDSHNGGRSVAILVFADRSRLVYKPRSVESEVAWFALLAWLNARGGAAPLKHLRVLTRPGYGWVEAIAPAPLPDEAAADEYYRKAGALLALTYIIGTNDLHYENLIACGRDPVLIDLETVMCHAPRETIAGLAADDLLKTVFFESVVRTGLLPRWQAGASGAFDVSGLGAVMGQRSRIEVPQWKSVNSDATELVHETVQGKHGHNAPILEGVPVLPERHLPAILGGFEDMYRLMLRDRAALLAADGPLAAFERLSVRFLLRATAHYMLIAKASRAPHLLRDGAARSIHLERLLAPMTTAPQPPLAWPLTHLERRALGHEDVPYLTAPAASAEIDDPDGAPLQGILEAPCYDQTRARIEGLSEQDLRNQCALVRAAIEARLAPDPHGLPSPAHAARAPSRHPTEDVATPEELIAEALRVAEAIVDSAIPGPGGAPHWITLRHLPGLGKMQLDPVGPDVFEGRAGIALALATIAAETQNARLYDTAQAIALDLARELRAIPDGQLPADVIVHGTSGIASLVYAFFHLARLLGIESLNDEAEVAANLIDDSRIAQDIRFDVIAGAAGTLLSLLPLARQGSATALNRAIACGKHLLAMRTPTPSGERCWATFEGRPISGLAHGNAGIALGLIRLSRATGEARYRNAALEAMAFENRSYSHDAGNWQDLRWPETSYAAGWCHGGPGMALARLEALAAAPLEAATPQLCRDVEAGAGAARMAGLGAADHLCCGNMGRALLLHEIGTARGDEALVLDGRRQAAAILHRAGSSGGFRFMHHYSGYLTFPGLFQGSSGIAYALLRMARPKSSPDFLSLNE